MKKVTYQLDQKRTQAELWSDRDQVRAAKKGLIDRYRKQHVSLATPAMSPKPVVPKGEVELTLRRENRRLKRQLKKLKQLKQNQTQAQVLQQQLYQMKHQLQATRARLRQSQTQIEQLQQNRDQMLADQQGLQQRLTQTETYVNGASTWLVYSLIVAAQTEKTLAKVQQQAVLNQAQRPITAKEQAKLQQHHDLKHQVIGLNAALKRAHARTALLLEQNTRLRRQPRYATQTLSLAEQVRRLLTVDRIDAVKWLPDAYQRYRKLLLEDVMVNDGNRIFGYFINHQGGYYFKGINGQVYRQYRCVGSAKRQLSVDAVYAGKVDGKRVLITSVFRDVTPSQLKSQRELQLHRRHARKDYQRLLPKDAKAKLAGKQVLVVTWQRTQRLNQMLRAFGMEPLVVNDKERSISWITAAALSNKIDFTLLLSEGLSHSLLATVGKTQLKARHDIELVYNESPEELLRRCYRFFSR